MPDLPVEPRVQDAWWQAAANLSRPFREAPQRFDYWLRQNHPNIPYYADKFNKELIEPSGPMGGIEQLIPHGLAAGMSLANPKNVESILDALKSTYRLTNDKRALALAYARAKYPGITSIPAKINVPPEGDLGSAIAILTNIAGNYDDATNTANVFSRLAEPSNSKLSVRNYVDTILHESTHALQTQKKKGKGGFPFNILEFDEAGKIKERPYVRASEAQGLIDRAAKSGKPYPLEEQRLIKDSFFKAYEAQPIEKRARLAGSTAGDSFLDFTNKITDQKFPDYTNETPITPEIAKDIIKESFINRRLLNKESRKELLEATKHMTDVKRDRRKYSIFYTPEGTLKPEFRDLYDFNRLPVTKVPEFMRYSTRDPAVLDIKRALYNKYKVDKVLIKSKEGVHYSPVELNTTDWLDRILK